MRILALDLGKKRIGCALSDPLGITAQPLTHVKRTSIAKDLDELRRIVEANEVTLIVMGMPYDSSGNVGIAGEYTKKFAEKIKVALNLPVEFQDERFSTVAVERVLIDGGVSRAKRKGVVDKQAAAYILQGYLDARATHHE